MMSRQIADAGKSLMHANARHRPGLVELDNRLPTPKDEPENT